MMFNNDWEGNQADILSIPSPEESNEKKRQHLEIRLKNNPLTPGLLRAGHERWP